MWLSRGGRPSIFNRHDDDRARSQRPGKSGRTHLRDWSRIGLGLESFQNVLHTFLNPSSNSWVSAVNNLENLESRSKPKNGRDIACETIEQDHSPVTAMGTTSRRTQMDPGVCFHPVYASSYTQYACKISTRNRRTKNTATPECGELAQHQTNVKDIAVVHSRIFLCRRQGIIRTTVNTIE